jgi:probable O-glycosylation ligase (exosortase A-associated)
MKQTAFMILLTLIGTGGVFVRGPFVAVAIYYLFAVLRPQYLWAWALPANVGWSLYVAIAAIAGTLVYMMGVAPIRPVDDPPFRGLPRSHWLYLTFGLTVVLSYFTARSHETAWPWLIEYLKIFLMFTVAAFVVRRTRQVWTLYLLATLALVYIGFEVNSLYITQGRIDIYRGGYGGLDNNGAGLMLAMGIPLAIYAWEASGRWWRWLFAAAVPILTHAVLMTYSRGAMVALLLTAPVIIARSRRRWQFAGMAALMALAVPVMAGPEIRARFISLRQYDQDLSAYSRFDSWRAAVRMANDYPLLGVGIRNSNLFSYQYGADMEGRTIHSQYLQILADSGYVALLLYISAMASLLISISRTRRRLKGSTDEDAVLARSMLNGIESAILLFSIGSLFLSLEVFELPYMVSLLGGQIAILTMTPDPSAVGALAPTSTERTMAVGSGPVAQPRTGRASVAAKPDGWSFNRP